MLNHALVDGLPLSFRGFQSLCFSGKVLGSSGEGLWELLGVIVSAYGDDVGAAVPSTTRALLFDLLCDYLAVR